MLAHEGESEERNLATLGPGSLFGEAALLTDAPRNATVRALDPCELLALHRSDLLEAVGEDRQMGDRMLELLRLRDRPRQAPGIQAHHRATATGETITTLKDPERGTYYRLSPGGWFVWQRLDGEHNLRDLTLEYLTEFQAFAPQAVAETVGGLAEAGFAEGVKPASGVLESAIRPTRVPADDGSGAPDSRVAGVRARCGRTLHPPLPKRRAVAIHLAGPDPAGGRGAGRVGRVRPRYRRARHRPPGVGGRWVAAPFLDTGHPGRDRDPRGGTRLHHQALRP